MFSIEWNFQVRGLSLFAATCRISAWKNRSAQHTPGRRGAEIIRSPLKNKACSAREQLVEDGGRGSKIAEVQHQATAF
jgi:hypothetical protein